ncbi:GlxA family transcriptional regulator [Roseomonas sp. KE2513]|uniref:GlxA family transcriptional regulator n=1 Tax=Roseomonas sp. KE2513 TaxID=2479202 RepID=UPI0018DF9F65|nr:AraC family transcriptional regulator [Roseomonas sp. KE2513]
MSMTEIEQILPPSVVAILAFDGVQPIDFSGPAQAFVTANEEGANPSYAVQVVGPSPGKVMTAAGFEIVMNAFPSGLISTLVIPGGPGVYALRQDAGWMTFLATVAKRASRVCSVCTGAFLAAAAGLLDGRRAVTHWRSCARLAADYPAVMVDGRPLFIEDGPVWTTAGVTAGIDLTLALIERDHGAALAARVARRLVVPMRRAGGQKQFSNVLALQNKGSAPFDALLQAIAAEPSRRWSVQEMAAVAGQSPRNFHRRFVAATGTTPARAVESVRAELAETLLRSQGLRVKDAASISGFGSGVRMRRARVRQGRAPVDGVGGG